MFDDNWRVAALHRGSRMVGNVMFRGKSTAFVGAGTQISAILEDMKVSSPILWERIVGRAE